jgi:RNA polymerase-binding transcription factor
MAETADPTERLVTDRGATVERLARLRRDFSTIVSASSNSNADDEHDPEGSTIAFERAQVGALIEQAEGHLTEIEAALSRIAEGTFGRCAICGRDIAPARLEARPTARTCITCANQQQSDRSE